MVTSQEILGTVRAQRTTTGSKISPYCATAHARLVVHMKFMTQSRSQRPRSFWSSTGIVTSGQVQLRKSTIHGLLVTLRMLRVKSDKSDWLRSQSIVFPKPFKTRMSLDLARGPDFQRMTKRTPLERGCSGRQNATFAVLSEREYVFMYLHNV